LGIGLSFDLLRPAIDAIPCFPSHAMRSALGDHSICNASQSIDQILAHKALKPNDKRLEPYDSSLPVMAGIADALLMLICAFA
jgi:hypothetical protein